MDANSFISVNGTKMVRIPFLNEMVMEAYLLENIEALMLPGYEEIEVRGFEVNWPKGDKDGRIDLLVSYDQETLAVVELKNDVLEERHLDQLDKYVSNKEYLKSCPEYLKISGGSKEGFKWIGILVGTGIKDSLLSKIKDKRILANGFPLAVILLNRFRTNNQIFAFSDLVVPPRSGKDNTKYKFNGSVYGKSRLVLALVKQCEVDGESLSTAEKIGNGIKYPNGKPFMLPFDEAMDINNTPTKKGTFYQYYFPKESEAVVFEGVKYAVSYWWTSVEMPTVLKNAKDFLEYTVEEM